MYVEPEQNVFTSLGAGDLLFLNLARKKNPGSKSPLPQPRHWATQSPLPHSPKLDNPNPLTWGGPFMENHIKTTIKHCGDRCLPWDANQRQLLNGDGTLLFQHLVTYTIGPDYLSTLPYKFAMEAVRDTEGHQKIKKNKICSVLNDTRHRVSWQQKTTLYLVS